MRGLQWKGHYEYTKLDDSVTELIQRDLEGIPARDAAGIREVEFDARRSVHEMVVPDWLTDQEGLVVPGALGIIADTTLGTAVMSTVPVGRGMVTTHLHLELLRAPPPGTRVLRCEGRQGWLKDRFGLGEGEITTDDGLVVARATIGCLLVDSAPNLGRAASPAEPGVNDALGTDVLFADIDGVRVLVVAAPRFANSSGGVHGGIGVLIGERVLDLALRHALAGERAMRPVELRAAFVRPIAADGGAIECRATMAHLGRRLAAARGEVRDHEGRPAVLVDATYISE